MTGTRTRRGLRSSLAPLLTGLALSTMWAARPVQAQTPAPTQVAPGGIPDAPPLPAVLADDPRLDVKVTMLHRAVTVRDVLRELTQQTGVRLAAAGNEAPGWQIAVAVRDEPLRDVLRALAAVNDCHWKRVKANDGREVLTLMDASGNPRYWDFLRPKTQAEADMRRGLEDFQQQVPNLPLDMQQSLATDYVGVSYTSLPPGMQQSVQQAMQVQRDTIIAMHGHPSISADTLGTTRICLKSSDQDGITNYTMNVIGADHTNMMILVGVPDDLSARDETIRPPNFSPWNDSQPQILAARFEASRAKALQNDPRLSQIVSVKSADTSLGFALAALAEAAHVNIVAEMRPTRHTISLGPVPLKDALDQITAKYHAAWAEAADGTILVGYHVSDHSQDQQTAVR